MSWVIHSLIRGRIILFWGKGRDFQELGHFPLSGLGLALELS